MKKLENYGVQEMDANELICIDGGFDYIDYYPFPPAGSSPLDHLEVGAANMVIASGNACIAVANAVQSAWDWVTS